MGWQGAAGVADKLFGWSRFLQQSAALTYKNLLVAWRSRRATLLRLMAPFVFLLLALVIQLALDANSRREQRIRAVEWSAPEDIGPIPDCNQDVFIANKACRTFLFSPNDSSVVQDIVNNIKASNTPPIRDDKVLGFASRFAAEDYMLANPETTLGAVHFSLDGSNVNYIIQTNTTTKGFRGGYQSSVTFFTMPFMSAVARETAKVQLAAGGRPGIAGSLSWEPKLVKFPHPQLRSIGMVGFVLGPFIFAACMFGMITQLGNIVGEKESGLVTSLRHMGLLQSAYWASWVAFDLIMALATALSIVMWGNILQFRFFLRNDARILVVLFWLFACALNSFAYFVSVFLAKQQSAVYTGFVVCLVGWICQTIVIFGLPYDPELYFNPNNVAKVFFWIFACLPWCPLSKAVLDLAAATNSERDPGLRWSQRPSETDLRRQQQQQHDLQLQLDRPAAAGVKAAAAGSIQEGDEDVAAEAARMYALLRHRVAAMGAKSKGLAKASARVQAVSPDADAVVDLSVRFAVEVYGLSKVFKGGAKCCTLPGCGPRKARKGAVHSAGGAAARKAAAAAAGGDFWAIRDSWFGIEEGQLFCLLGPNGAGKTTTINCLTGVLSPSGGEMLVCGESVTTEGSLDRIRPQVGVCPQFDVLWGELTGLEHLVVAGHVKGLPFSQVRGHASELLQRVQLLSAAGMRSGSYSGGMKRRLSVAQALLGDPKVLYLDEPTTGMDPISRRYVWDVIQAAKPGRAIVLTTHSMEEADILGDRIAIMARGRLRAIGSSIRLKQKFGAGYQVSVTLNRSSNKPASSNTATGHDQPFDLFTPRSAAAAAAAAPRSPLGPQQQQQQHTPADLLLAQQQQQQQEQLVIAADASRQAVKQLFAQHLDGLGPAEESKYTMRFLVPRQQEQQLVGLLQLLEQQANSSGSSSSAAQQQQQQQHAALAGVADVQLSLTSLEEVFLNIAKQAELEEAAVTGARVLVTLPDSGKDVLVGVGQDWLEASSSGAAAGTQKCYQIKWDQDESGALTVLEVVPVLSQMSDSSSSSGVSSKGGSSGMHLAPVAG
ncbi:hypothetical protein OEZ85_005742 [Tetradesmus obliquus]|uniref:ABC transporter domain-containing protein n=2 Tax=Tetradesmus obliquus TaxID=3088 RepID=A0ABY8UF95_TETOB|nr:hypothetical protein OEZ85_005742 [Tetradesmus obliquus]